MCEVDVLKVRDLGGLHESSEKILVNTQFRASGNVENAFLSIFVAFNQILKFSSILSEKLVWTLLHNST